MIGQTQLLTVLDALVKRSRADGISVCAEASTRRVCRFAYQAIHQNLVQEDIEVTVKVIRGRRVGVASTDTLAPASLTRCVKAARDIAANAPQQQDLPDLPGDHRVRTTADHFPATARMDPRACVGAIQRLFHLSQGSGAELAGSMVVGEDELAVANSAGVSSYTASTIAGAKLVTMYRTLSGYASGVHRRFDRLDLDAILQRSLRQCLHREEPVRLPLGTYEVIVEPEAVAELLDWLGAIAFGAKSLQERTSCLTGRMGETMMSRQLTIYDDGTEPETLRMPFDYEGVPKQNTLLIDRGKAVGVAYDTAYGKRFGRPSTGHGMTPDHVEGPLPLHLGIAPGRTSVPEMIASCQRGLLIPRFHYVNGLLNPREALMTGLLREGVFLIERGKVVAPVTRMRFTQGLVEAFRHVLGVSRERRLVADPSTSVGSSLVPTLHLARFKFTGRSGADE